MRLYFFTANGDRMMNTYFDGLQFNLFGINKKTSTQAVLKVRFYGLQYIHSGLLNLCIDHGKAMQLKGPVAFLTDPEHFYEYGSPQESCRDHLFVCFSGERVNSFISGGLFRFDPEQPFFRITAPERFYADMLDLIMLLQNPVNHHLAVAKLEYMLLLLQNQENERDTVSFHREELENLTRRIITAPEQEWNFAAEAKKMNISFKHLIRIFQQFNTLPPARFVLRQRLLKAAEMLIRDHNATIKSIAYECGFENEFYFSRVFRKYMKISPKTYRNKQPYIQDRFVD